MNIKIWRRALCAVVLFSSPAWADFTGEVTRIIDGDTVEVVSRDYQSSRGQMVAVRVRLADIDAPESRQPFGSVARQHLAEMLFRQAVRVEERQIDQYGRTLGVIYAQRCLPACREFNVNAEMVMSGMAWAYRFRNRPTDPAMYRFERQAKAARLGLWSHRHAQEPWQWRRDYNGRPNLPKRLPPPPMRSHNRNLPPPPPLWR